LGEFHPFQTQHTTLRCIVLFKCAYSSSSRTMTSLYEITPMGRKKKALRDLLTNPRHLRSFPKPTPFFESRDR